MGLAQHGWNTDQVVAEFKRWKSKSGRKGLGIEGKTKLRERNDETAEKETGIGRKTKQMDSPSVSSFFLYKETAEKETGIERNRYRKKNETDGLASSLVFLPILRDGTERNRYGKKPV